MNKGTLNFYSLFNNNKKKGKLFRYYIVLMHKYCCITLACKLMSLPKDMGGIKTL